MKKGFYIAVLILTGTVSASAQMAVSHAGVAGASNGAHANVAKPSMSAPLEVSGKPVARVNGVELLDRDLLREMYTIFPYAQQHNGFPKELEPQIRRGALEMIIFEELVYQEAKRRNMAIPAVKLASAEKEFRSQFASEEVYRHFLLSETNGSDAVMKEKIRRSLLIESLLNQEVNIPGRASLAQARIYYDANPKQYEHDVILHIQSISIVPPNQTAAVVKEAKQRAEDAISQAKQAKTYRDFGLLAERISDDDFHVNMGDHRPQPASAMPPPIVAAAAKMKPGDVSDLIQLGDNYTIFRLEKYTPAGKTPFSEVKAQLQSDLQKKKTEQLRSALGQKLRKNSKIETL